MSKHNAQCRAEMHHLSQRLPQHSCHPPPALTRPATLPGLAVRVWKTQCSEGMDCAENHSHTFPGSSPEVFLYNNSLERSDKTDFEVISHCNPPQSEHTTSVITQLKTDMFPGVCKKTFYIPSCAANGSKRWVTGLVTTDAFVKDEQIYAGMGGKQCVHMG